MSNNGKIKQHGYRTKKIMRAAMGSIQRLDKGRYRVSLEGEPTGKGKRTRKTKVVRGDRDAAEVELAKMKLAAGKKISIDLTVDAFWKTVYLPSLSSVRENTRHTYARCYEHAIKPRFGDTLLDELTAPYIEAKLWEIEKPSAQRHAYAVFRQIINMAYAEEYMDANPFSRRIRMRPIQKQPPIVFNAEEFDDVSAVFHEENIEPIVLAMLHGGLRREEACALYWEDIQFEGTRAYISRHESLYLR